MSSVFDGVQLTKGHVIGCASRRSFGQARVSIDRPRTTCSAAVGSERADSQAAPRNALDVVARDLQFIGNATGLDLTTPLEHLTDMHDQVVCTLNPFVAEHRQRELEEKVHALQNELRVAHEQVHDTEDRLNASIAHLSQLQKSVSTIAQAPVPEASSSTAVLEKVKPPTRVRNKGYEKRSGALENDLSIPEGLKEFWHPVEFSSKLQEDIMFPIELFGENWVLFRDENGTAQCIRDECAHRACPLSLGTIVDGKVQCPYHGWEYNGTGLCTKMPSTVQCKGIRVEALPVAEQDGLVWVWPGTGAPPEELPTFTRPPSGFEVHAELLLEVPVEHGLLLENLLDLAHAPFTHTSTFAKGWPIPDVVRFHARKVLGGNWEPYPIDMSFEPPCMVLSTIGLAQPGKIEHGARAEHCKNHLHQLHVCLPAGEGRTRLLYRMSMDFLGWTKYVPGIQKFWANIANQVLGEDLVLVEGQQDRLKRGGDVWAHPVPYDKLGVRYRRWRNAIKHEDQTERENVESELRPMSAGELFAPDTAA